MSPRRKKPDPYLELPWYLFKTSHFEEFGYSGTIIKGLRIDANLRQKELARLLKKRNSTMATIESTEKVGIALSKQLAEIFKLSDWRVIRNRPKDLEKYLP